MAPSDALRRGRDAYSHRAWTDAYVYLSTADREGALHAEDTERAAVAAYLIGRDADSTTLWGRAHQLHVAAGASEGAARCAFWLAFQLLNSGEMARGSGWMARAARVLDAAACDCVVRGYLLVPAAIQRLGERNPAAALELFQQASAIGERFRDADLIALARHGCGRSLIRLGDVVQGIAMLDEVMVAVTADEISPLLAGDVYCSVIEACNEVFDWRRAHEWTSALNDWCSSQPDLVPYRGQCLVRRAEILQVRGRWTDAMAEAQRACEQLSQPRQPAIGSAFYQRAELHRLRGEFAEAEATYRAANDAGRKPQPGLSLLRKAQGHIEAAAAGIRTALDEARDPRARSRILGAYAEIMMAAHVIDEARSAARELSDLAAAWRAPALSAAAAYATGAVLLAERKPRVAHRTLSGAWETWCELDAQHEAARTRVLLGDACRQLGDPDTAKLEFAAARQIFEQLGAAPDLARLDALSSAATPADPAGLTPREAEVLRLLATGMTNRSIADRLCISEKTVARHVSNIFGKLDVPTRAAATAYAHLHHLIKPST